MDEAVAISCLLVVLLNYGAFPNLTLLKPQIQSIYSFHCFSNCVDCYDIVCFALVCLRQAVENLQEIQGKKFKCSFLHFLN